MNNCEYLRSKYRTHTCAELRSSDDGKEVRLSGWVHRKRDHGGVVFVDLRDNYGVTQIVFRGEEAALMTDIRVESVLQIEGSVALRDKQLINSKIETGEIEVICRKLEPLSMADILPFQIAEDDKAPEAQRLTYRFLELRREKLHNNILLRSKVIASIREIMQSMGFLEYQTPILTSSSPEGARDFLVPSRFHPGRFFALPQAPQQFKQLLMVSGFDRYFQIAPCFRDEDPRADRSPGEFYQVDIEMSFVEQEDVFKMGEELMYGVFARHSSHAVTKPPFPRIRYDDAISKYGTDKPDLRNPLIIEKVSQLFQDTSFKVFRSELERLGDIFALKLAVDEVPSRKYFDDTIAWFTKLSGQGTAYLIFDGGEIKGSVAKFFSQSEIAALKEKLVIEDRAVVFFAAGSEKKILPYFGRLRVKLGEDFKLIEEGTFRFCWITDYPMYERDETTGEIGFSHNPFSMPQGGMDSLLNKNPLEIYAYQYDIVCNGHELSSGAIRNHDPEIMYKAFEIAGYSKSQVDSKFGGMIKAFRFGAPPHGGMAPGVDRIVMLLAEEHAIRDVIAFPLSQTVEDLLMGAPCEVSERQLREVHIQVVMPKE
ncbi:MAG: aspartate--tRNA ligase [Deltaproteobacteria bacterium]|nr:aspartate--tRNA ligase [Deltaproteobacteria bacterium]